MNIGIWEYKDKQGISNWEHNEFLILVGFEEVVHEIRVKSRLDEPCDE